MFKKSKIEKQLNLLTTVSQHLNQGSYKRYTDTVAWHNVFFQQITSKIDEKIFSCLFSDKMGAPNAPIRQLIAMMILKEGHGWSDLELFENCEFNLLVRKSLGIYDIDQTIPTASTYYLLRKRMVEYNQTHGIDLFAEVFKTITQSQIAEFEISGKSIRMDSKLIGSNIAFYSRYQIIHQTLCLYAKDRESEILKILNADQQKQFMELIKEDSSKTVYRSTKEQINKRLNETGYLIYTIINICNSLEDSHFKTLKRVFKEQYRIENDQKIELRPKEEISAQSVQSPHDTECHYRNKNDQPIKGYSHNVTETCNDTGLNLITDLQVEPASEADNSFVIPSIEETQKILPQKIENMHTDGAYNSQANRDYAKQNDINFYATGMQGAPGRYDLNNLAAEHTVLDKQTGELIQATKAKNEKFRIETASGYRYFDNQEIERSKLRLYLDQLPDEIKNKRNNVESTIYQLAYHLRKDKTRYRGHIKNRIWATLRCLWINLARITKNITEICQRTITKLNNCLLANVLQITYFYIFTITRLELNGKIRFE